MTCVIASPRPFLKSQEIPIFMAFSLFERTKCAENRLAEAKRLPTGQMFFHFAVQSLTRGAPCPRKVSFFSYSEQSAHVVQQLALQPTSGTSHLQQRDPGGH